MNKVLLKSIMVLRKMQQKDVAKALRVTQGTMSAKLNGKSAFSLVEVKQLQDILSLTDDDIRNIFFVGMDNKTLSSDESGDSQC